MPIRGRASKHIVLDPRVSKDDAQKRFAERDQRLANDTRTEAQKWLNDPAPGPIGACATFARIKWCGEFPRTNATKRRDARRSVEI
jgi:hypothetical protein